MTLMMTSLGTQEALCDMITALRDDLVRLEKIHTSRQQRDEEQDYGDPPMPRVVAGQ
jgi:hypothetical protein